MPTDPKLRSARKKAVADAFKQRAAGVADRFRDKLIELYGKKKGSKIKYAEAFELCEYGRRPQAEELKKLFPFF